MAEIVGEAKWDVLPRMLQELCDGHPGYSVEVFALELPNGVRLWLCRGCWSRAWLDAGCPPQPSLTLPAEVTAS